MANRNPNDNPAFFHRHFDARHLPADLRDHMKYILLDEHVAKALTDGQRMDWRVENLAIASDLVARMQLKGKEELCMHVARWLTMDGDTPISISTPSLPAPSTRC